MSPPQKFYDSINIELRMTDARATAITNLPRMSM